MLLVYGALTATALGALWPYLDRLGSALPDALSGLTWLLQALAVLILLALVGVLSLLLSQTLAAPFYGALARRTERLLTGRLVSTERGLLGDLGATFGREWEKLRWTLPRLLLMFAVTLIPGLGLLASPLTLLVAAWLLAGQFLDFTQENRGQPFATTLGLMRSQRMGALAFGLPLAVGVTLPVLGALVGAQAAIAGTVWVLTLKDAHPNRGVP
jgi:CysZ protein